MENRNKQLQVPFTQVVNQLLQDQEVSLAAKGLFAVMVSKPDGWQFSAKRLGKEVGASEKTVLKYLAELEARGWLTREREKDMRVTYAFQNILLPVKSSAGKITGVSNKDIAIKSISNKESIDSTNQIPEKGNTPLARLKNFYVRLYCKEYGVKPKVYLNGKEGAVLKSLLKDYSEWQVCALLLEHFRETGETIHQAGFPLTWVGRSTTRYIAQISEEFDFGSAEEIREYVIDAQKKLPPLSECGTIAA